MSFERAQMMYERMEPPEPHIIGKCHICGEFVYKWEIDSGFAFYRDGKLVHWKCDVDERRKRLERTE